MRSAYPRLWVVGDQLLLESLAAGHALHALPSALLGLLYQGGARLQLGPARESESDSVS